MAQTLIEIDYETVIDDEDVVDEFGVFKSMLEGTFTQLSYKQWMVQFQLSVTADSTCYLCLNNSISNCVFNSQ